MRKGIHSVLGLVVLIGVLLVFGGTNEASAQLQVNVNIVTPPPLQFAAPPDVYVIPSGISYVYMVPNYYGLYFYNGYWYRFYNGYWFRSVMYNGYWEYMELPVVPQCIIAVPPEYVYYVPSGYYRIHYHDLHSHWRTWDQDHHWNRYDWYQHEMRDDVRRQRYSHIEKDRQYRGVQEPRHQQGHGRQYYDVQQPSTSRPMPPPHRVKQQPSVAVPRQVDPPHRIEHQPLERRPEYGQRVDQPRPQHNQSVYNAPQRENGKHSQPYSQQNQPAQKGGNGKKESKRHGNANPNG